MTLLPDSTVPDSTVPDSAAPDSAVADSAKKAEKAGASWGREWIEDWQDRAGSERTLRVRWLLNPDCEPLRNVELTELNGFLLDARTFADDNRSDCLPAVLIPPLVNAHTHLEFSSLTAPLLPAHPFPDWIQSVIRWRQQSTADSEQSVRAGLEESVRSGVGLIGEIATQPLIPANDASQTTVVQFLEVIGLRPERIQQQLTQAEHHLQAPHVPGLIRAISPHAPYTVHPDLLEEAVSLAERYAVPLAMHLGETQDELELLQTGGGRFADFLTRMGLFDTATFPGGRTLMEFLEPLSKLPHALAVHGNYFGGQEIEFLAKNRQITTVYCPRTHAYFGHSPHPFRALMSAGCRVILGTDSRASNPDLELWRELQTVARLAPDLLPGQLISMVTTHAAAALGRAIEPFQIHPGREFRPILLGRDEGLSGIPQMLRDPATTLVRL